jgi:hypothetical protein
MMWRIQRWCVPGCQSGLAGEGGREVLVVREWGTTTEQVFLPVQFVCYAILHVNIDVEFAGKGCPGCRGGVEGRGRPGDGWWCRQWGNVRE